MEREPFVLTPDEQYALLQLPYMGSFTLKRMHVLADVVGNKGVKHLLSNRSSYEKRGLVGAYGRGPTRCLYRTGFAEDCLLATAGAQLDSETED